MSFTFDHSVKVAATPKIAYNVFDDPSSFEEIMVSSSIITRDCNIIPSSVKYSAELTFGAVCTQQELASMAKRLLTADKHSIWTAQALTAVLVTELHFKLNEEVVYLGFKKVIPVTGTMYAPRESADAPLCQFEHRKTDDGLVETRKMRVITSVGDSSGHAEIWEELAGKTSWYLKYFVEMEARRSHEAVVKYYATHFDNI